MATPIWQQFRDAQRQGQPLPQAQQQQSAQPPAGQWTIPQDRLATERYAPRADGKVALRGGIQQPIYQQPNATQSGGNVSAHGGAIVNPHTGSGGNVNPHTGQVEGGGAAAQANPLFQTPFGIQGDNATDTNRQLQNAGINTQLGSINQLRQELLNNPVYGQLGSSVSGSLSDPSAGYADARNQQLAQSVGAFNQGAQQQEGRLGDQFASRGLGRSGLYESDVNSLERNRRAGVAQMQNRAGQDIASRAAQDQRSAQSQGLGYLNTIGGLGNQFLNQQGNVLGNIQVAPEPGQPSITGGSEIIGGGLANQMQQQQGGGVQLGQPPLGANPQLDALNQTAGGFNAQTQPGIFGGAFDQLNPNAGQMSFPGDQPYQNTPGAGGLSPDPLGIYGGGPGQGAFPQGDPTYPQSGPFGESTQFGGTPQSSAPSDEDYISQGWDMMTSIFGF